MDFSLKPAMDYTFTELAQFLNLTFSGYIVDINITPSMLSQLVRYEGTDLTASRVVWAQDEMIGCALVGRRGWSSRIAAMGISPDWRGEGVGHWLLERLIREAKKRRERAMVLEVIEQNTPAVRLYKRVGFQVQRRLVGYSGTELTGLADDRLQEADIRQIGRNLVLYGDPDLPWQLSGETLLNSGPPLCGYQLGPAYAIISNPNHEQITIRGIVVDPTSRRQGHATRLLQAIIAAYPGKAWGVPIIVPESLVTGLFEKVGFSQDKLTQYQMNLSLI